MPSHKSNAKRMRQNVVLRERNRANRGIFRGALKKAEAALASGDAEAAAAEVQATLKIIGKTAKKGLIHEHKAARHFSILTKKLNAMVASGSASPAKSE